MAKKLSDIDLRNKRKAESIYESMINHASSAGEKENAAKMLKKPAFKSFLKDIVDKKNEASGGTANVQPTKAFLGGSGSTVKDPEPPTEEKEDPINNDAVRESLKKTFEKLRDILKLKRKNSRLRNNLNKRGAKPGDTARKRLGLGTIGKVASAILPVNILGALGDLIGLAVLNWLGDPRNKEQVQMLVKIFTGIIRYVSWYITGTINNLLGGFNQLISGGSIAEKIVGFFRMFAGIVGLKWLLRPGTILKDILWGFNRLKKWPSIIKQLFKGGSRKSIDAIFQKHNSLFRTSLTRTFKRAFLRIFGTFGKKILRSFVRPIVNRVSGIPLIGPIISFLINWLVFKESPGRSVFKAAGAGIGMWTVGALASFIPIPVLSTWVGAALGGVVGDWIGGAVYDLFFGGGGKSEPIKASETNEAGNIWDVIKKLALGIFDGAKKAVGWVGKKAKGAWNWMFGGGEKDTYTEPEVKTMIANSVSHTSQVSQMSKDFEIEKKVRERRIKTRATLVAIQNRRVNSINISGSPDRTQNDDLNTSISDTLVLSRI